MAPTLASFSFSRSIPISLPSLPPSATLPSRSSVTRNHPFLPISLPNTKLHSIRAPPLRVAPPESTIVQTGQDIVSAADSDDGVSSVISALLFVAFIGLSILTLGVHALFRFVPSNSPPPHSGMAFPVQVIYLGVTDFLQKREKDKFDKEEAANSGKQKKKKRVRVRAGPKGFGQKIIDDDATTRRSRCTT